MTSGPHTPVAAAPGAPASPAQGEVDPFLWLEEVESPRALDWVRERNRRSLTALEADPRFAPAEAAARAILNSKERLALGPIRDGHVYNFWQDEANVRGVWRRSPLADYARGAPVWEVLLDIDALAAAEGRNWVFKGVECLEGDPRRCLVALSDGGKDAKLWREFDPTTRTFPAGGFSIPEAKSSLAWADADTLILATDWGPGTLTASGYPFVLKRLARGEGLEAAREILRGAPQDVAVFAAHVQDEAGRRVLLGVRAQTFFTSTVFTLESAGPRALALPPRASVRGLHEGELLFTIEENWRGLKQGALASVPLAQAHAPDAPLRVLFAPGPREAIEEVAATRAGVLTAETDTVRGRLMRHAFQGGVWKREAVRLPPGGAVQIAAASPETAQAFALTEDFATPQTLHAIDSATGAARPIRSLPALFDASGLETRQYEAVSKDGTKIPYFVVSNPAKAKQDGQAPTLLYGYGGFQVSIPPAYSPVRGKLWAEAGGVFVLANIRGGGEFGPAWHQAGLKTKRQVVYDDFIAVAEDLIARKITSPRRLGIMGGSNGGLLMGVMLTQRPELFHAAVVQVPLLDMLRFHLLLAGASWVDEYGSPEIPEERAFLARLSPYHNLAARKDFPVPFLVTSTKDDRVHPGHARKYAAKLEALGLPYLYYENIDGGHSADANLAERARRQALEYTYLKQRLFD